MSLFRILFAYLLLLSAGISFCASTWADEADTIDFSSQVRPILSDRCFHCHGPDADNQESGFRMDSEEELFAAVEPGDTESSELHRRIFSDDPDEVMPPPDSNRSLSEEEKRTLEAWIKQGAPYEGHWAFDIPHRPDVPDLSSDKLFEQVGWTKQQIELWSNNQIDSFIAYRLAQEGLTPSSQADKATLLRRASMTLTGLLPDRELQNATESSAAPSDQYESAIDSLLDSMAYAERQALRWLDAARYADTDGYQNDRERTNWPWRDWVIKAFRDNMPFDQFTIEQIAGDMLPDATVSQRLASAFNRNHRQNAESGALAEEYKVENVIDRVETTSTVFLGLTFGCARCHDHKYDPLSQREFYQLYAYFNNIGEKGIGRGIHANPTIKTISPLLEIDGKWLTAIEQADNKIQAAKPEFEKRLKAWIAQMKSLVVKVDAAKDVGDQAKSAAVDAANTQNSTGQTSAPVNLSEDSAPDPDAKAQANSDSVKQKAAPSQPSKEELATFESLGDHVVELLRKKNLNKEQKRTLGNRFGRIDAEQSVLLKALDKANSEFNKRGGYRATVMIMREREGENAPAYLLDRGQYDNPVKTDPLPRAVPEVLLTAESEQPTNRLSLARWLVSRDNPLTARVIVNRIWQDHFGVGLVKTVDDFGVQGEAPSHPALLDWLAVEFIESGWNVKAMHRLILTSAAYQQSSKSTPNLRSIDPNNRLLARGPRYRADGFAIRDIALQASGLLHKKPGGPAVKPYQPGGLWEVVAADAGTRYKVDKGQSLYRKSMYTYWKRAVNPPRQTIFDAGGREVCNVQVRRTNTPLQALVMLNDPTFIESARVLAEQVLQENFGSDEQTLSELYQRAIAKPIDTQQLSLLSDTLITFRKHFGENPEEAAKLLSVGQAKADDSLSTIEHAALTAVAHVILNTDEFITIE